MAFKEEIIISAQDQASGQIDAATASLTNMNNILSVEKFVEMAAAVRDFGMALMEDWVTGALEAEKNAIQLEATLTRVYTLNQSGIKFAEEMSTADTNHSQVINSKVENYTRLAEEMQKTSVLEDDSIIRAAALIEGNENLRANAEDYLKILPDLAGALELYTGQQVTADAAARELIRATEGGSRAFKQLGIDLTNKDAFIGYEKSMLEITKTTDGSSEAVLKSDHGFRQLQNTWGNFKESLGQTLMPALDALIKNYLLPLADWLNSFSPQTKETIAQVILWGTAITGLAVAVGTVSLAFTTFGTTAAAIMVPIGQVSVVILGIYKVCEALINLLSNNEWLTNFFEMFMSYKSGEISYESILDFQKNIEKNRGYDERNLYNNIADVQDEQEQYIVPDSSITAENLFG